ncbi:procollagen-lysine,2-oxoglutarate 5-dioxygenase [Anopheles ziemanni]|uniref:procollagen-lysine,2-oxoglutarate 5-dioxygenase n=1 Tax=Anopheles coustani TaxID=139045 RepID=UPI0026596D84|nr:procollagen-lysine,2-oxoglutarate 5-dioxygenase [Anopheles coustani]XP_058129262.1 procollagen-lysine,2-oxoglutarate 5-dioxygenase [Anopheles coustani]XP_058169384.1 procollagen-lysine,2-oxoglutarate 5-dioxygenase [Anopheles ziemanni]
MVPSIWRSSSRSWLPILAIVSLVCLSAATDDVTAKEPLIFTVASNETEGYVRFLRSAKHYELAVTTLGMGKPWLGGNMKSVGGGYKINLLREALKPYRDEQDRVVLFTDSYDVVFLASWERILEKFTSFEASIVFGAEPFCWPDESLKTKYPPLEGRGMRFLNSGLFMGYADKVYKMLKTPSKDTEDDQLYYTKVYLDKELREELNIKLDHMASLFQNLNGVEEQVVLSLEPTEKEATLANTEYSTKPAIVHGNGPSKLALNSYANYLAGAFVDGECKTVHENRLTLPEDAAKLPLVTMALFVEKPTPFLEEWFDRITKLNYPGDRLDVLVHSSVAYHAATVKAFLDRQEGQYRSLKAIHPADDFTEPAARTLAAKHCEQRGCDYLFVVDSEGHLDNPDVLRALLEANRNVISPVLTRPEKIWSNFWGALSNQGFYARSNDYMDIVSRKLLGLWNVPFISIAYLVKRAIIPDVSYELQETDPDMAMCWHFRSKGIFMHVINVEQYGHLVDTEYFDMTRTHPDFYQLFNNRHDWEQRYLAAEYKQQLEADFVPKQPCPDVYWLAIGTERFCDDLREIVEAFGEWSDGSHSDKRLQGGYEAVPTRDIHMNQVGLEQVWLKFLQLYVRPLQEKVFIGYFHDPPRSLMNFVVRYRPDEQPSLRPHHDSSTYTINIALNSLGTDYEGGGCRFLRYNCSVVETRKGWMLLHPGRLTHFHEGLVTTKGTRYIMISFVDP